MVERNFGKRNDDIVRDFFGEGLPAEEVAARSAAKEELFRQMVSGRTEQSCWCPGCAVSLSGAGARRWPWPAMPNRKTSPCF